jgi:hypothetical protein
MAVAIRIYHNIIAKKFKSSGKGRNRNRAAEQRFDDNLMNLSPNIIERIVHAC